MLQQSSTEPPSTLESVQETSRIDSNENGNGNNETDTKVTRKLDSNLARFRTIAKVVKHNLRWTKLPQTADKDEPFVARHSVGGQEQLLTFNAAAYKPNVQSICKLSDKAKYILGLPSWSRSDEDLEYLYTVVRKIKTFDRYSESVKRELVRVLSYEMYESGRVVVQQGQPGEAFYIIVGGCVTMELKEADKLTGVIHKQRIGELGPGATFGELALLHESKRSVTVICKDDSEFLRIHKEDFDLVLRRSHQQNWDKRLQTIKDHSVFADWPDAEQRTTCNRSKLLEYPPNAVILSDIGDIKDNIYFIISGNCKIVREVDLLHRKLPTKETELILPPIDTNKQVSKNLVTLKTDVLQRHLLQICTIGKGMFFGVGEDLRRTHVIAAGRVVCLVVSRSVFARHGDRREALDYLKRVAQDIMPDREHIFQCYMDNKRWRAYRKKLILDIVKRQSRKPTKRPMFRI